MTKKPAPKKTAAPAAIAVKASPFKPDPIRSACKIEGCEGDHYARGWCQKHYRRFKRLGHPLMGKSGKVKVGRSHD